MTAKFRPATAAWLVLLSVVGTAYCQQASVGQAKPPFTISRQTTHVDGPLNADGTIDYLRAFNQAARRSAGGRNAAPAILRATGPELVGHQAGREIAQALGMRELPPDGDYFVRLSHYLPQAGARRLAVRQTTGGPWHPRQYRQAYEWLKANRVPLDLIREAAGQGGYYMPLVQTGGKQTISDAVTPRMDIYREIGQGLVARAMLKLRSGDATGCWANLLPAHRLARLIGAQPLLKTNMAALDIERLACGGDRALISSGKLSGEQAKAMLADMKTLGPGPRPTEAVDFGERCAHLSLAMRLIRLGPKMMDELTLGATGPGQGDPIRDDEWQWARSMVYWDGILKSINRLCDAAADAFRKKTGQALYQDAASFARETETFSASARAAATTVSPALAAQKRLYQATVLILLQDPSPDNDHLSRKISALLGNLLLSAYGPALHEAAKLADRVTTESRLSLTAAGLVAYKAAEGKYPEKLGQLQPAQLDTIPKDVFSGRPLRYYRRDRQWILYSIGPNTKDDGGKSDPRGGADDLVVTLK